MIVTWLYNVPCMRRKRSTSPSVSVVIYYQPDGGEEAHYPPEGSVAAEEREVVINGKFDVKPKYEVWLKVYEGGLAVSSLQTKPHGANVEKGRCTWSFCSLHGSSNIIICLIIFVTFVYLCILDICAIYIYIYNI